MADEKKDDCGCDGCGCSCSKQNVEGEKNASVCNADSPSCSLGEAIAAGAIVKMEKGKREEKKHEDHKITEADIDGFIERCDKEGKNPLDVVKFIAEINGIDISFERVPMDSSKRGVYDLLKGVVKKVLIGFVSYCADNYGLGLLQSLIECLSCRDSETSSRSPESVSENSVAVSPVSVRLTPIRVGCAFTW